MKPGCDKPALCNRVKRELRASFLFMSTDGQGKLLVPPRSKKIVQ